ncbi:MAG: class I SAM-dependent rRNA methyltransferase [Myxococcales bacterium]|nr:class I SAM-dependent rRNA methyltransferase [Myxococcales bacterium]MCB9519695.1 class I SAM-dependent rRNA methyltransferase [Myxococcales bacterium]MCB9533632.1 class I SAM-dependent rRNA methyltransferase [Myxococcales bacterium]
MNADAVREAVARAAARRVAAGLGGDTTAYRLVHDRWDALPGVRVDRLGDVASIRLRAAEVTTPSYVETLAAALAETGLRRGHVLRDQPEKVRGLAADVDDGPLEAALAAGGLQPFAGPVVALERGQRFELSTAAGFSCGLFFDMRDVRAALASRWSGRKTLNLFAYTCGFGVALGARNEVINVDTSGPYLEWGRRNYALNGLEVRDEHFVRADAFAWLEGAVRRGVTYDAVTLDPPSYSAGRRGRARRFSVERDLGELIELAVRVLAPSGELFVATNHEALPRDAFAAAVRRACAGAGRRVEQAWDPPPDYPVDRAVWHLRTALIA